MYCYNVWKGPGGSPSGELPTAEMRALIEKVLRGTRCPTLSITGGEPFVRDDIPDLIAAARASGAEGLRWIEALLPTPLEVDEALEVAQRAHDEYGIPIACLVPIPPCAIDAAMFPGLHFGACPLGTRDAYFTIDSLRNLREKSFYELAGGEEAAAYARAVPQRCRGCRRLPKCRGGCRAAGEVCFGSPDAGDPWIFEEAIACERKSAADEGRRMAAPC